MSTLNNHFNAQEKSEDVRIVSIEIQRELDECIPAVEASCKAVELIERNELKDVKSTNKPTSLLRLLMEPVCLLLDCKYELNTILVNSLWKY